MNNFKALYTKYRPSRFKDVLGQDHVTKVLEESIKMGNISHAYIFSGGRGTGKTSIARIFAREIGTSNDDLYEIDAASNNGVEEIRTLNDSVSVMPFSSKYKVYILDEAHMLSKSAFNALLKTLEEPPSYVIFILATTEIHKIPETVISRCESYTFKKPNQKILKDMVIKTAKSEGYVIDQSSAELIALLGDGSFRDTHGILQKVINSSNDNKICVEEVEKVTGAPKSEIVDEIIDAISIKDSDKALELISKAVSQNIDIKIFISLILAKIRSVLILRYSASSIKNLKESYTVEEIEKIKKWSTEKTIDSRVLSKILESYLMVGVSYLPQIPLEIAIIEITNHD
jgi:DNA polymerase III subunit gamma/tau